VSSIRFASVPLALVDVVVTLSRWYSGWSPALALVDNLDSVGRLGLIGVNGRSRESSARLIDLDKFFISDESCVLTKAIQERSVRAAFSVELRCRHGTMRSNGDSYLGGYSLSIEDQERIAHH
jgi:hypothetical protein